MMSRVAELPPSLWGGMAGRLDADPDPLTIIIIFITLYKLSII